MNQFENEAQRAAESMDVGTVRRLQCPACGEKHYCVGRESDRVWWKCFRASCNNVGVTGSANLPSKRAQTLQAAVDRLRPYLEPMFILEQQDQEYFKHRFELSSTLDHIRYTEFDEYAISVRGPSWVDRGVVIRQPVWRGDMHAPRVGRDWDPEANKGNGGPMPKTKLYATTVGSLLAWYFPSKASPMGNDLYGCIVIVEDQISAMKCAEAGVTAVALLGNSLTVDGVRDICRQGPRIVTVALDPGAEGAAHHLASKWGLYFNRTRVIALEADPKDVPIGDLISELGF